MRDPHVYPVISDNSVYNNLANTICKSNAYSVLKAKTKVISFLNFTIVENLTGKILSEKSNKFAVGAIIAAVVICIVQLVASFAQNLIMK